MQQEQLSKELTICDQIDIRKTGLIQDFGYIFVFDKTRSKLIAYSKNVLDKFPQLTAASEALKLIADIPAVLPQLSVDYIPQHIKIDEKTFALYAHTSPDQDIIVELEALESWQKDDREVQAIASEAAWKVATTEDFGDLYREMVASVQALTQFKRVMVYRFHPDLHGEVVAELVPEGQEPFLGLHYPASDIPKLARQMYLFNRIRHIGDVDAIPVEVGYSENAPNLRGASLRGVAPVHIQYLKNMGVQSSFSISLISENELWGLIACHHDMPTRLSPSQRASLDMLGRAYSSALDRIKTKRQAIDYRSHVKHLNELFRTATLSENLETLVTGEQSIISLIDCDACALFEGGKLLVCNPEHEHESILQISNLAFSNAANQSISFVEDLVLSGKSEVFAGSLKIPIGAENGDFILFLRKEVHREVKWGGEQAAKKEKIDPHDPKRLQPRSSFALWTETVRGRCKPWSERDMNRATLLQDFFITYWAGLLKQKNQAVELHAKQLELFINMASHDIKSPLRAITYNVGMVREMFADQTSSKDLLKQAEDAAFRIERILDEFLLLSTESRENALEDINPAEILKQVALEIGANYHGFKTVIADFPKVIKYSRTHFEQLCANICGNAAKFAGTEQAVQARYYSDDSRRYHEFSFTDQGEGIPEENLETIFKPFTKLGTRGASQEGLGLGLAICRRILGYCGGRISAKNIKPHGTEIRIKIPKLL